MTRNRNEPVTSTAPHMTLSLIPSDALCLLLSPNRLERTARSLHGTSPCGGLPRLSVGPTCYTCDIRLPRQPQRPGPLPSRPRPSRLTTAHISGVQTRRPHRVLGRHPCEEALQAQAVAAMGRRAVPGGDVSSCQNDIGSGSRLTFADPCTSNSPWPGCPACRKQPAAPRSPPFSWNRRQSPRRRASGSRRSPSPARRSDPSSCKRP